MANGEEREGAEREQEGFGSRKKERVSNFQAPIHRINGQSLGVGLAGVFWGAELEDG